MRPGLKKRLIGYPLFFGGVYLGGCLVLAYFYIKPIRTVPSTPELLTDVLIPTDAGPDPAWATPSLATGSPRGSTVFVMAHGYGGNRAAWRGIIEKVEAAGYEAVAPALPGQDASPDATVGFGLKESKVLVDTVRWVRGRFPANRRPKVILLGVSMGGAACWLASEQIPDEVDAVITEGAFARFDQTMNRWLDAVAPYGHVIMRPVVMFAQRMGKIDPSAIVPVEAASRWKKPALVIQAERDKLIARDNADDLAKAANCPLWIVPEAVHANCYLANEKGYIDHLLEIAKEIGR